MIVCCLRDCRKEVANRPEASELKELAEHPLPVSELQEVALPARVEFLTYLGGQSIQLVKLLACDTSDFLEVVPESLKIARSTKSSPLMRCSASSSSL